MVFSFLFVRGYVHLRKKRTGQSHTNKHTKKLHNEETNEFAFSFCGQRLRNCITIFASSNCNNKKSDNRMAFKILPHHTKSWTLVYAVHVCYLCGRRASTQQTTCCRRNWRRKLLRAFIYGRANVQAFRATHTHPYLHTLAKYCGNHFVWVREIVAQWTRKYVCAIAR